MSLRAAASNLSQLPQLLLAAVVVGVVGMMLVPLPTPVLDLLIAANLSGSVLVLAVALYASDGLAFTVFPSLLLLSTLYRLALNVSSTRLILLQADAGRVIEAFGSFVVRGDYLVGAVIFVILTIIQFTVIARGAERVAEVSARFTLDALPGKQLAIDAEQRRGQLSQRAARAQRARLDRESQFYGAMDGAMKFVKGDAIASIVITLINLVAGVGIGTLARGAELSEAVQTYGLLTIGDGLVSQLPALLVSTAAGLVVTRVASDAGRQGSLGEDLLAQLGHQPRALWVAAGVTLTLALVPGFPGWAFVLLSLLLAVAAGLRGRALSNARSASGAHSEPHPPLSLDDVQARLDTLCETHPALLSHTCPAPYPVPRLARLLRALQSEGLSPPPLVPVLESLAQLPAQLPDHELIERLRAALGPQLSAPFIRDGTLTALRLDPLAQEALLDARVEDGDECFLALTPALSDELCAQVLEILRERPHPLLVPRALRAPLSRLLRARCPGLTVLSPDELPPATAIETAAWLGAA